MPETFMGPQLQIINLYNYVKMKCLRSACRCHGSREASSQFRGIRGRRKRKRKKQKKKMLRKRQNPKNK
jgi:hypothetical protein